MSEAPSRRRFFRRATAASIAEERRATGCCWSRMETACRRPDVNVNLAIGARPCAWRDQQREGNTCKPLSAHQVGEHPAGLLVEGLLLRTMAFTGGVGCGDLRELI